MNFRTYLSRAHRITTGFARAAFSAISWKLSLAAFGIAFLVAMARFVEHRSVDVTQVGFVIDRLVIAHPHFPDAHFVVAPLAATFFIFAALAAREGMRRGAGLNKCVLLGVAAASIATATAQWYIRLLLGGQFSPAVDRPLNAMAVVAVDVAMLGALFMVAYLKHELEREILSNIRHTELRRVELDRHRLASNLELSRAVVDPQWLSAQIQEVRDLYEMGVASAEIRLDELICELRRRVSTGAAPSPEPMDSA